MPENSSTLRHWNVSFNRILIYRLSVIYVKRKKIPFHSLNNRTRKMTRRIPFVLPWLRNSLPSNFTFHVARSRKIVPIYFLNSLIPGFGEQIPSNAQFVERRKLVSPLFFFFFLLSSSPELRGCSRCNTGQPATSCLESNSRPAACLRSLLAARKQIGSYNSLPRNDYVFSCNVCNGDFKHEGGGGGGRRGEGNRTS